MSWISSISIIHIGLEWPSNVEQDFQVFPYYTKYMDHTTPHLPQDSPITTEKHVAEIFSLCGLEVLNTATHKVQPNHRHALRTPSILHAHHAVIPTAQ